MHTKKELEPIIYAITLQDRAKYRHRWLLRGFKITNARPGFLLNYWDCRLSKGDKKDIEMYLDVLGRYKKFQQYNKEIAKPVDKVQPIKTPSLLEMSELASKAAGKWIKSGMQIASESDILARKNICSNCQYWDSKALRGTGRCKKCGCSTWAKIRLSTESCPEGYWGEV